MIESHKIPIIHVITRMDMGGSARNTLLTCLNLPEHRYRVTLIHGPTHESDMTVSERAAVERDLALARNKGVKIVQIPRLIRRLSPITDLICLLHLWRIFAGEKPAIVHTHTSKAGITGRLAAKLAGVPVVVHTPHGHVFFGHFPSKVSRAFKWIEKAAMLFTHHLVALTKGEYRDYLKFDVAPKDRISIIHSGVDLARFMAPSTGIPSIKQSLGIVPNVPLVGFVGWLIPVKGTRHLIDAMDLVWNRHPDVELALVGKGFLENELKSRAAGMRHPDKIHFLGWREDIAGLMHAIDLLVLPSLNEGMGRVVVEAMAAGKPVVASRVGGIPDLVIHEWTGLLVPPEDSEALAQAICRILSDSLSAKEMGRRAKVHCRMFSLENMINKLDRLYQDLAGHLKKMNHL